MNTLKIVFEDVKKFAREKLFLFCIFIISLVIASFSFCVFVASNMHMANIMNTYRNVSNKYFIGNKEKVNKGQILALDDWLKKNNILDVKINLYSDILMREGVDLSIYKETPIPKEELSEGAISGSYYNQIDHTSKKPYDIIIGTNNNKSNRQSFVGKNITKEDNNYIMIDYTNHEALKDPFILNKTIDIRNRRYIVRAIDRVDINENVIKFSNINNYDKETIVNTEPVVIPIKEFLNDYNIYCLDIIIPSNLSKIKKQEIDNYINSSFSDCDIYLPERIDNIELSDVKDDILTFVVLIVLALINILALFIYWIDNNWRKYVIYRICGANTKKIYKIIVSEASILAITSIIIGTFLYYLSTPLLGQFNISYILRLKDVCLFQSFILFLVIIIVSIDAIKINRISPRYMERR